MTGSAIRVVATVLLLARAAACVRSQPDAAQHGNPIGEALANPATCAFVGSGPGNSSAAREACYDVDPSDLPAAFSVRFELYFGGDQRAFTVRVNTSWAPPFAARFWQLAHLGFWEDAALFRPDYRNSSTSFVVQTGLAATPIWNALWTLLKTDNATAVPVVSNTRGFVSWAMDAVGCSSGSSSGDDNPCAPYRPACTSDEYCAVNFTSQFFVNYADNSRLDANGFAPFGQVDEEGMATLEDIGFVLGNLYGELSDICCCDPPDSLAPYCIFDPETGQSRGVNSTRYAALGSPYLRLGGQFQAMYDLRIRTVEVVST